MTDVSPIYFYMGFLFSAASHRSRLQSHANLYCYSFGYVFRTWSFKICDKFVPSSIPLPKSMPTPTSSFDRRKSLPVPERKITRPQISPALYATPEATPLPDSPSSFPPSQYIINHKRCGPRLLKSHSVDNVAYCRKNDDEGKVNGSGKSAENKVVDVTKDRSVTFSLPDSVEERNVKGVHT